MLITKYYQTNKYTKVYLNMYSENAVFKIVDDIYTGSAMTAVLKKKKPKSTEINYITINKELIYNMIMYQLYPDMPVVMDMFDYSGVVKFYDSVRASIKTEEYGIVRVSVSSKNISISTGFIIVSVTKFLKLYNNYLYKTVKP